jgi:hypothetical protein
MKFVRVVLVLATIVLIAALSYGSTPSESFAEPVTYDSLTAGANSVAVGDVNGDGYPDFIVATNNGVTVYLNDGLGDGLFVSGTNYPTNGTLNNSVAVADLRGNGWLDIIVTNTCTVPASQGCYGIAVLLNDTAGDGGFEAAVNYDSGGLESGQVVAGDLTGNGFPDLIVASNCQDFTCAGGTLTELMNKADGTGTFATYVTLSDAKAPIALGVIKTGDQMDLLTSAGVMLGNGDGTFQPPIPDIVPGAISFALADVNGDGIVDAISVVPTKSLIGEVAVQLGNGDGTFQSPLFFKTGTSARTASNPLAVTVADFNGDGLPDLAVLNECTNYSPSGGGCLQGSTIGVLPGNGDGTFRTPVMFQAGGFVGTSVATADVTDFGNNTNSQVGKIDLITSVACSGINPWTCPNDGDVGVLLNNFATPTTTTVATSQTPASLSQQPVTFTATITSLGNSSPIVNGSAVSFTTGATTLCSTTTTGGGATCSYSFTSPGTFRISATFAGDLYHKSSVGSVVEVITKYSSTTMVSSSPNPSTYKQAVTLTANVSSPESGGPTGYVTFFSNGTEVASATLSGGVATLSTTKLAVGSDTITATYHGDTLTAGSSGTASAPQQVNP